MFVMILIELNVNGEQMKERRRRKLYFILFFLCFAFTEWADTRRKRPNETKKRLKCRRDVKNITVHLPSQYFIFIFRFLFLLFLLSFFYSLFFIHFELMFAFYHLTVKMQMKTKADRVREMKIYLYYEYKK